MLVLPAARVKLGVLLLDGPEGDPEPQPSATRATRIMAAIATRGEHRRSIASPVDPITAFAVYRLNRELLPSIA
jgi:hypothetical protein